MDINNNPIYKINEIEPEKVSQKPKAKDTEFQAEKGRDLLGVQGDSRHVLLSSGIVPKKTQQNESSNKKEIGEVVFREISNKEFDDMKFAMIDLGDEKDLGVFLDILKPENIVVYEKILSDDKLAKNESIRKRIVSILYSTHTFKSAKIKFEILDRFIKDDKLNTNKNVVSNLGEIASRIRKDKQLEIVEKYFSERKLNENPEFSENIGKMISYANSDEKADAVLEFIERYINDDQVAENIKKIPNGTSLMFSVETKDEINPKLEFWDKFAKDEKLCKNKKLQPMISEIITSVKTSEQVDVMFNFMKKLTDDDEIMSQDFISDNFSKIISQAKTQEDVDIKGDFINKIFENKEILASDAIRQDFPKLLSFVDTQEKSNVKIDFLKKIVPNQNVDDYDKYYLSLIVNSEENTQKVMQILENPEYVSNSFMHTNINTILFNKINDPKMIKMIMTLNLSVSEYSQLKKKIGVENIEKLPNRIEELKEKYGMQELLMCSQVGDDNHIRVSDENGVTYKFNTQTLELDSIIISDNVENLKTGTEIRTSGSGSMLSAKTNMEFYINRQTGETVDVYDKSVLSGEYEIWRTEPSGHKHLVGLVEVSKNGTKHIEKTLTSLDGTKTNTVYAEDKEGNIFNHYQIKSADGEVLYETTKKRKVISENHYQTEEDGQAYDIEINNDEIITTKLDDNGNKTDESVVYSVVDMDEEDVINSKNPEEALYDFLGITKSQFSSLSEQLRTDCKKVYVESLFGSNVVSRSLLPALSKMSGSEWFALDENTSVIMPDTRESNACSEHGVVRIGDKLKSDLSVILHEFGHEKFENLDLANNEELKSVYEEEKELFTSSFPDETIKSVNYFLEVPLAKPTRAINEVVAETNAILNTYQSWDKLQDRTILLQQYFPRTIAKVAELLKSA